MQVVWGDELGDETQGQDVLGVRGIDQRLEASLVNGITTISLRGRYLTLLPWLLGEFFEREVALGATEFSFDRLRNYIARVEYLTLASTQLDPEDGDGGGALGTNLFNVEMGVLRSGGAIPFPADRTGTMLGIYVGPCRAMGILANSDGTSAQPVVLTPRGTAIWAARNAALEGTGLRDLLWSAETLTPDQARAAAPHFSLRSLHRSGQEAALLQTALLDCWAPPASGSVVEDAYSRFAATVNWLLEEHSRGALHAETLLADNYRRACKAGEGLVDPVRVAWAEYEWRRRLHYGLELMASAFSETVLELEQAAPDEVIQAWAEEHDLPSQLTATWPGSGSAWGLSGGEAVASVPADLFLEQALPVQNLSAISPHSRGLCAFGLLAALADLASYRGRIVAVAGSGDVEPEDVGRQGAVIGFAPISTEAVDAEDRFDILIATDVLAEGVNLQQCRHIVNYDVPWNPMRLVQRHGRVDRIGSPHARVFLRTIFPADRLDQLLNLEQRIMQKIALAAASVGVASPVQGGAGGSQVFTETREEIERLLAEDPTLFERGGAASAGQTGEEYRQTLRRELDRNAQRITHMPRAVGSGMVKGDRQGVFFCASVGDRTYLRFVSTTPDWVADVDQPIIREIGTCLRLIECDERTPRDVPPELEDAVFDLWEIARVNIHEAWMRETDPANLQPQVRPLNQRVAEFIRANRPAEDDGQQVNEALDILEAPWPRREELLLRDWFNAEGRAGVDKARALVASIRQTGLEPFNQPQLLPPIGADDIEIICWMGIVLKAEQ